MPKGRRTFCSDQCVHEWRIRSDPGYVRAKVFERDRGICAVCGLDTEALWRWIKARELTDRPDGQQLPEPYERLWRRVHHRHRNSFWDADHIVPVVEGGGECGLENYRTLCIWCHQRVTAELRARLAARTRRTTPAKSRAEPGSLQMTLDDALEGVVTPAEEEQANGGIRAARRDAESAVQGVVEHR